MKRALLLARHTCSSISNFTFEWYQLHGVNVSYRLHSKIQKNSYM